MSAPNTNTKHRKLFAEGWRLEIWCVLANRDIVPEVPILEYMDLKKRKRALSNHELVVWLGDDGVQHEEVLASWKPILPACVNGDGTFLRNTPETIKALNEAFLYHVTAKDGSYLDNERLFEEVIVDCFLVNWSVQGHDWWEKERPRIIQDKLEDYKAAASVATLSGGRLESSLSPKTRISLYMLEYRRQSMHAVSTSHEVTSPDT